MLGDLAVLALGNEWRREEDGKKRRKRNWIRGRVISRQRDFMLSDCTLSLPPFRKYVEKCRVHEIR